MPAHTLGRERGQVPGGGEVFLDHVAHFVPDLDEASRVLEAAGFVLTPFTRQRNRTDAGMVPAGTSNRCAMLREGYLEFLTATDDTPLARQLTAALARHTGLHLLAFTTDDTVAAHEALRKGGFSPHEPVALRRPVETVDGEGAEASFTVLRVPPDVMPEGRVQLLRHHTPGLVWQERWMRQGNALVSLVGTLLCVSDPDEAAGRFGRFIGAAVERRGSCRVLPLSRGALAFVAPDDLARVAPFATDCSADAPWIVASALGSADSALTHERFLAAGIPVRAGGPGEGQTSYAFPPSIGAFVTVLSDDGSPDWLG